MKDYKIITDSCCDLGRDIRQKYDIDYARMNIVCDGQEKYAELDWELYSPKELYDTMRQGKRITTTQVPAPEFARVFDLYLNEGMDVLYIGCSSALSGSVNTAAVVARKKQQEYPDAKIICIDSLSSCLGEGAMAVTAAQMKDRGYSIEQTAEYIEKNRLCFNQFSTTDTLEYLRRAGRIKASKAFFGNLFGVKPIIISDAKGQNYAYKKVRGRENAICEIVRLLKDCLTDPESSTVYIAHADCAEDCRLLEDTVRAEIGCKDIYVNYIGPIIGASVGPGAVAVYGFGKEVDIVGWQ